MFSALIHCPGLVDQCQEAVLEAEPEPDQGLCNQTDQEHD